MRTVGIFLLALIVLGALLAPAFSPYTYAQIDLAHANQAPSWQHWFGTDDLGRDLFTRVWVGARISLFIGSAAACIDLMIGVLWGGAAAACGGWVDEWLMRSADVLYSLPYLLIVICLLVTLGQGLLSMIAAMTVIGWIPMARIVRGEILRLRELDYVLASRLMGGNTWYVLRKHLLPNASGAIFTTLTMTIPSAIFTEAFLSFVGLGVPPPLASWGTMASEGLSAMEYYPWRITFPALFIVVTVLAFHLAFEKNEELANA